MIPSLTGSLTNTKLGSFYGDVGQNGLFILWFNVMSELMFPSLTGKKLESLYGDVGQTLQFDDGGIYGRHFVSLILPISSVPVSIRCAG